MPIYDPRLPFSTFQLWGVRRGGLDATIGTRLGVLVYIVSHVIFASQLASPKRKPFTLWSATTTCLSLVYSCRLTPDMNI